MFLIGSFDFHIHYFSGGEQKVWCEIYGCCSSVIMDSGLLGWGIVVTRLVVHDVCRPWASFKRWEPLTCDTVSYPRRLGSPNSKMSTYLWTATRFSIWCGSPGHIIRKVEWNKGKGLTYKWIHMTEWSNGKWMGLFREHVVIFVFSVCMWSLMCY